MLAGVVALSSGSIALLFTLWPGLRPDTPPDELSASIDRLAVEPNVSFGTYLTRVHALDRLTKSLVNVGYIANQLLEFGVHGPEVATLQRVLKVRGDYSGPINGRYGPQTVAAVKKFQRRTGAIADGIVGPETFQKLTRPYPIFARRGVVVYVDLKVKGFRVREFGPLQAHIYDAVTHQRVRDRHTIPLAQQLRPVLGKEGAREVSRLGEIASSGGNIRPAAPIDQRGKLLWLAAPVTSGRFFIRVELYDLDGGLVDFADSETFRTQL